MKIISPLLFLCSSLLLFSCSEDKREDNTSRMNTDTVPAGVKSKYNADALEHEPPYIAVDSSYHTYGFLVPGSQSMVKSESAILYEDSLLTQGNHRLKRRDVVRIKRICKNHDSEEGYVKYIYEVETLFSPDTASGYLLASDLSFYFNMLPDGTTLINGYAKAWHEDNHLQLFGELIVLGKDQQIMSSYTYPLSDTITIGDYEVYFDASITTSLREVKGLDSVLYLIGINLTYEGCGYYADQTFFAWDQQKLFYLMKQSEGANSSYESVYELILPDHAEGKPNTVLVKSVTDDYGGYDEVSEDNRVRTKDSLLVAYHWTSKQGISSIDTVYYRNEVKGK